MDQSKSSEASHSRPRILERLRTRITPALAEAMRSARSTLGPDSSPEELSSYLIFFESGDRPQAFLTTHSDIYSKVQWDGAGPAFWKWLASEWSGFDAINYADYETSFARWRSDWSPVFMSADDRAVFAALPDAEISIFRGQDEGGEVGLSWTLDPVVAEDFAIGHRRLYNASPIVFQSSVAKKDIALLVCERKESEIVLFERPSAGEFTVISRPPRYTGS